MSLEKNSVLDHLRNCSGIEPLFSQRLALATQHNRKIALPALPRSVLGPAEQPHGLQTPTPLTPVQPLGKSEAGTGRNESSVCTVNTFCVQTKQQLLSERQFCKTHGLTESYLNQN